MNAHFWQICDQVQIESLQLLPNDDIVPWNMLDNNPLAPAYARGPLPATFQIPSFTCYIGFSDQDVHLWQFTTAIVMHGTNYFLLRWCFPMTLAGQAQAWFDSLPARSISSFKQLGNNFLQYFEALHADKNPV